MKKFSQNDENFGCPWHHYFIQSVWSTITLSINPIDHQRLFFLFFVPLSSPITIYTQNDHLCFHKWTERGKNSEKKMSLEPWEKLRKINLLLLFFLLECCHFHTSFGFIKRRLLKISFFFYQKVRCFFNLHFHNNNKWFVCLLENPIDNLTREKKTENFKWRPSLA